LGCHLLTADAALAGAIGPAAGGIRGHWRSPDVPRRFPKGQFRWRRPTRRRPATTPGRARGRTDAQPSPCRGADRAGRNREPPGPSSAARRSCPVHSRAITRDHARQLSQRQWLYQRRHGAKRLQNAHTVHWPTLGASMPLGGLPIASANHGAGRALLPDLARLRGVNFPPGRLEPSPGYQHAGAGTRAHGRQPSAPSPARLAAIDGAQGRGHVPHGEGVPASMPSPRHVPPPRLD
jgi:hypothetical protein